MVWRIRARLRFSQGSGMAQWALNQNTVRRQQAFHLKQGRPDQESSFQDVRGGYYVCDFFFPDDQEALAVDTYNTLTDPSVLASLEDPVSTDWSYIDVHQCNHDQDPPQPCTNISMSWDNRYDDIPGGTAEWVQPSGAHDAYAMGAQVTHNGETWESTTANNVWEPGVFGWVVV